MPAPIWNPPAKVANDVASATIAGYTFAWAGMTGGPAGGILSLRAGLRTTALVDLARALARIEGVRVTSGPAIASRGDCYLVHCPGFKMVLSASPGEEVAQALVSRTLPPALAVPCELAELLADLMRPPAPTPDATATVASGSPKTSTLRRVGLQPGKTLSRKKPLARKTPLGRGGRARP